MLKTYISGLGGTSTAVSVSLTPMAGPPNPMAVPPNPMAVLPPVMPVWLPVCQYQYLYRLLRPDEFVHISSIGIRAKEPTSQISEYQFVRGGSHLQSQYISTSATWIALAILASSTTTSPKRYAQINVPKLVEARSVQFLDLTIEENRRKLIQSNGRTAYNYAQKFDEVLIKGVIPLLV